MNEDGEPCPKLCGNCVHFRVLDDYPRNPCRWFGVCDMEASRDLGCECGTAKALDWAFDYGRHGDDDCEKPDEWFEEG
ncbi:hypothetical protein ACTQ1Z_03475 [Parolsenella sp. LCP21S3_E11]|uniref:hypothetical protein n=1 Tax=Parolsenella sp. LCP21S3_E11 TaxID=3438797 RepID=UPI003F96E4B2